jgi:uncharacterized protein
MTHEEARELVRSTRILWPTHGDLAGTKEIVENTPGMVEAMNALDPSRMDETPQGAAAHCGCTDILEYLLEKGVRLDVFMAVALGRREEVKRFLEADPSRANAGGAHRIPLLYHVRDVETLRLLRDYGAEPGKTWRETLLRQAAGNGQAEIVRFLIDDGAPVKSKAKGTKPLHAAAAAGHREVVELLLAAGASVEAVAEDQRKHDSWNGKTALQLAEEKGHPEVAALLRERGARA